MQPAMGDSGLALGAAINASNLYDKYTNNDSFKFKDTYFGPDYSENIDEFIIKNQYLNILCNPLTLNYIIYHKINVAVYLLNY